MGISKIFGWFVRIEDYCDGFVVICIVIIRFSIGFVSVICEF